MKNLELFFEEYAKASMNQKTSEVAKFYAQDFIAASKTESISFKNDEKFIDWLNEVFEFNKKVGLQKMKVQKIVPHKLGENFCKVTVTWSVIFSAKPDEDINFDIHYVLKEVGKSFEILLYISEQDQEELMKQKGIL